MSWWDRAKDAAERTANFVTGGMNDRKKSERITRWAKEQEEEAEQRLKDAQQATAESLADLGQLRVRVFETTVKEFVSLYEMMSAIQVSDLRDTSQTFNVDPELPEVKELKATSEHVQKMLLGGGAGALGGASLALERGGLPELSVLRPPVPPSVHCRVSRQRMPRWPGLEVVPHPRAAWEWLAGWPCSAG